MRLTNQQRAEVINLRRRHSLKEVAALTGLSLGTVKASISRSGLFTDNPKHRGMFTLPVQLTSTETLPVAQELPPQQVVTGDQDIDALIWLRQVIETGDPGRIAQAMEAAERITAPLDELETRYGKWLVLRAGHVMAGLGSIGFANLDDLADRTMERRANEAEAMKRFGDALWNDTQAEAFCLEALRTVEQVKWDYPPERVAERFKALPELMPHTLSDCLHELTYWDDLYRLRRASDSSGDYENSMASNAREWFVFGLLAELRPRAREEAKETLRYLMDSERNDMPEMDQILENLVS
ncbi:hypothetical protein [Aeromonas popoffii]|uniref:hypothetical protein n=1 Tax=Aeromonas popoffii TaxID=70856 RepID=UPI001ADF3D8E|nr:hypothetical protein [Aeromonas popoffii]